MQLKTFRHNRDESSHDDTTSLLPNDASANDSKKTYIFVAVILSVIITATISSIITYLIVNSNDNNNNENDNIDIRDNYDIAIVGAGSTGLIQAYLLSKQYQNLKIVILESLGRFGGRQFTSFIHKIDENDNIINSIHFENLAMRFNSYHTLTIKLISYLSLCDDIIPFWSALNQSMPSRNQQLYQYRNQRITGQELYGINTNNTINYFNSIFNVRDDEISYLDGSSSTIWRKIYDKILEENNNGNDPFTQYDWYLFRTNYTFNGEYLYNYGESIGLRVIGNYSREINSYLYRSNTEQLLFPYSRNLAMLLYEMFNTMQYTANHTNNSYQWTLKNGYGSMNAVMYQSLFDNENVDVLFKNKVTSIQKRKNDDYYKYIIESNNGEYYYGANKIILSLPPDKTLKLLPYSPILDTTKFANMLDSFVWSRATKMNLIYDSTFWIDENIQSFIPSDTDLEIKRFLLEDAWTNGTLTSVHIYASGINNAFWYGAQLIGDKYPIHSSLKLDNISNDTLEIASIAVVEHIVKQVEELTQKSIPMPLAAFITFSDKDMDTSGITRFKVTANADEIIDKSYNPIDGEDIFMAISDFAWYYGWMESSISAAINNLHRNFNITNPFTQQQICPFPSI